METEDPTQIINTWSPIHSVFKEWIGNRENIFSPGLNPEPTIKVLIFLALFDSNKPCTYEDIKNILKEKGVIKGNIPDNTLRTSAFSLGKTLEKFGHPLELRSFRGRFQLVTRSNCISSETSDQIQQDFSALLLYSLAIKPEDIAKATIEKAILPLPGLYFLEWSARWWETYSSKEAEIRVNYETNAWAKLGIKNRLLEACQEKNLLSIVGLAPGEGLAEISLLKKILDEESVNIHYLAIDSSPKLLRDHIGLLKETLTPEIESGRLICAGVVADLFSELRASLDSARQEFKKRKLIETNQEFIPSSSGLLVTYFGNCLGNNNQDQETEFFSMVQSTFQNRPLEILVGVSVMRNSSDQYIRNWDDFLLQSLKHLLETKKLLFSSRQQNSKELPEFTLPDNESKNHRCPPVKPEPYIVRHNIKGQIYRFYYKLSFDLSLSSNLNYTLRPLPKGTLILLHSIIKYDMKTLVTGIEKTGLFQISYDTNYHQIVNTQNGKREYAVFSAYLND